MKLRMDDFVVVFLLLFSSMFTEFYSCFILFYWNLLHNWLWILKKKQTLLLNVYYLILNSSFFKLSLFKKAYISQYL